jgi:hypothetical protein
MHVSHHLFELAGRRAGWPGRVSVACRMSGILARRFFSRDLLVKACGREIFSQGRQQCKGACHRAVFASQKAAAASDLRFLQILHPQVSSAVVGSGWVGSWRRRRRGGAGGLAGLWRAGGRACGRASSGRPPGGRMTDEERERGNETDCRHLPDRSVGPSRACYTHPHRESRTTCRWLD